MGWFSRQRVIFLLVTLGVLYWYGPPLYEMWQENRQKLEKDQEMSRQYEQRKDDFERTKSKVLEAKSNETSEGKEWELVSEPDPASGIQIVRSVSLQSDDGLCSLNVKMELNGDELILLWCSVYRKLIGASYESGKIKFDTSSVSKKIQLSVFGKAYKPTKNIRVYDDSGMPITEMSNYDEFINDLKTANYLAYYHPGEYPFWTRFAINKRDGQTMSAATAIDHLGKPMPEERLESIQED